MLKQAVSMPRMIFLRTSWMKFYNGLTSDPAFGYYKFIEDNPEEADEQFNFDKSEDTVYGYAPITIKNEKTNFRRIDPNIDYKNLETFENDSNCKLLRDVTIVFYSCNKNTKNYCIVGWYEHATIFEYLQSRIYKDEEHHYICSADRNNVYLIPYDKRNIEIPNWHQNKKIGFGRSPKLYADKDNGNFRRKILAKLEYIKNTKNIQKENSILFTLESIEIKKKIEENAIKKVIEYYENEGYIVCSVEKDNVGWDLEARKNNEILRLEVKGRGIDEINVQLSANEYLNMKKFYETYKLCVVTKALDENIKLSIFDIKLNVDKFYGVDGENNILEFEEKTSAVCRVRQ